MTESNQVERGRLKVFLGYASGIGKSYKMLAEADRRRARGQDVVIGATQPGATPQVEELLKTMEVIPMKIKGGVAAIDMNAILRRRPQICIIDGLAYDNPPGSRNAHRWEDVDQLLSAGITVVTSVNLQFIDRQRETVEKITGKPVSQTIPQQFLETADEIELVDAPHELLVERGAGAEASEKLLALRRLALVLAADVADASLRQYLHSHGIQPTWGTQERILVYLEPGIDAEEMIQSGRRNADRFHGDLIAAYFHEPTLTRQNATTLERNLDLARAAGARLEILHGDDPIEAVVQFAKTNGVTQVFAAQNRRSNVWARLFGASVSRLIRAAPEIDVRIFPD